MKERGVFDELVIRIGALGLAGLVGVVGAAGCAAEHGDGDPPPENAEPVPTFTRSCAEATFGGEPCYDRARAASCDRRDGSRVRKPSWTGWCCGDLANIDGNITCI